jgi:hypothetical protein
MHLSERGRRRRSQIELTEALAPVGPEFRLHPPPHESGAHRGRLRLQTHQLLGIIGGQRLGDRREQLRDLHHWALHRAERLGEGPRVVAPAGPGEAIGAHARREGAGVDAEPRVTASAGGKSVDFFVVRHVAVLVT